MEVKQSIRLFLFRKIKGVLITAAVIAACEGSAAAYSPAKVYALMDPGESSSSMSQFAALTTVDGLVYRARWRDLEAISGVYNWSTLDAALDAVQTANKRLTIHIGANGGAWPNWLTSAGAVTYSYTTPLGPVTDPLPWDTVFLNRYDSFVAALAAHIQSRGNMSLLNAISVGAPVSEMSLVGCQNNLLGGFAYSRTSYLSAWAATIGSYRSRFSAAAILVSAPVSAICRPDNDGSTFYSTVMTTALPTNDKLAIFAADLNALGSSRVSLLDASIRQQFSINLQTIWSSTNDPSNRMAGTLQDAVCQGLHLGAGYFEIYKSDLSSSDAAIRSAIDTARTGRGCPVYSLTVAIAGSGSITASSNGSSDLVCGAGECSQDYDPDSLVTLSTSPGSGYTFTGWSGACTGSGTCTVTMDAGKNVTATFTANPVNGSCGSSNGAALTAAPTNNLCTAGTAGSVTGAGPWNWNCSGSNGGSNATCSADLRTWTVTPVTATGGSFSPAIPQTVKNGATASFAVTPSSGYQVSSVTGCGGALSGSTYTTGQITSDCTLTAAFIATQAAHDGIVTGGTDKTAPDMSDARIVLRYLFGLSSLSPAQLLHADVAPVGPSGSPQGNGAVDLADVMVILRRVIGVDSW